MSMPLKIAAAVKQVPPLSESARKLTQALGDGRVSLVEIARIVETDPGLAVRVMQTVNSPAFGLMKKVDSITRAVSFLGDKIILSLALDSSAGDMYHAPLEGYVSEQDALWKHSLYTAISAREVARFARTQLSPEAAYTAGLLHDIGKAVIDQWLSGQASALVEQAMRDHADYNHKEQETINTDHAEVGALLMIRWELPETLRHAVAWHHSPGMAPEESRPLAYAVHLGDYLAMMNGVGTGVDTLVYSLDSGYSSYFNITSHNLELISLDSQQEYQQTIDALQC
ncbi:HDOD domain-containing protein [Desulfonatronovibrio magnus]|uniref:HDOD domain-containing protein n=1 Tax=Desulfonatronovibrio magnus TaxID=698827 RepID=UPI0018DDD08F|nr:HDOD domain-containing protein [Desulfonatronovibrio magnus]